MVSIHKFKKEVLIKRIQQDVKTIKRQDDQIKELEADKERLDFHDLL